MIRERWKRRWKEVVVHVESGKQEAKARGATKGDKEKK
jgi:hypothetical protein